MDKLKMHSKDKTQENYEILQKLFPNAVTETIVDGEVVRAIDKDVLQQEINATVVDGKDERYQFTWPDKKRAVISANAPINKTLRPCREESVNFDTTENLYIEGDNLEVLKLLQETYLCKIKMIYIDPPYNTGDDFIYEDDFSVYVDIWKNESGDYDENGNRLMHNTDNNGRFHTDWLNMIYPRLKIAKDLLSDDGVIFISIDDNEVDNLKKICDEIFGAHNFEVDIHVKVRHEKRILREDIRYQLCMEHILCYRKLSYSPNRIPKEKDASDDYCWDVEITGEPNERINLGGYPIEIYDKTKWKPLNKGNGNGKLKEYQIRGSLITQKGSASEFYEIYLRERRANDSEGTLYRIIGMGTKGDGLGYRYIRQPYDYNFKNGFYYQGKPIKQQNSKGLPYPNYWDFVDESNNVSNEGGVEYKGGKKPVALIEKLLKLAHINKDAIVMDFFSGSATTAHAVINSNTDGGNRKYIMVQLPENLDEAYQNASPKNKASLKNTIKFLDEYKKPHLLTELGKIRINNVYSATANQNKSSGYRVLKLDSSNMKDVYYNPADFSKNLLDTTIDNIKEDRTAEDLLFQVMLDLGVLLSSKIEETEVAGKKIFNVSDGYLMACFDEDVNEEVITAVAKQHPIYFVMRDSSLSTDTTATNFDQIFETYSPTTVRRVI